MKTAIKGLAVLGALALSVAALFAAGQSLTLGMDAELKRLQGYWEGEGAGGKCAITITNNTLHYRAGTNWFLTTFTLPEKTNPQQLHATVKDSSPPTNSVGTVVHAIFKIEHDTLTLATIDVSAIPAQGFEEAQDRYIVKKTAPPRKDSKPSECNPAPRATSRETNLIDSLFKFPFPAAPVSPSVK